MSTSSLLLYIFLGSAALAYMTYGKSQRKVVALFCGIGLAALPYFNMDMWIMISLSFLMMALPFFIRI
ncbi:hypothetical protein [Sulfurovum sp. NBC37-1]|uniref:hypothetical protein n=1 Tax=Sulfurovum sp. (strain NBC37-1) TaxID=387093 RepID=UPI00015875D0|nr:hypothetical protein [Sulfurovum sp. NBC37-1]BAF71218.1 conserved hypothetical protein [Sulfurovum sp. NBC37-1]